MTFNKFKQNFKERATKQSVDLKQHFESFFINEDMN
jgi:hypothetical protein